jgi:hypothetical protein
MAMCSLFARVEGRTNRCAVHRRERSTIEGFSEAEDQVGECCIVQRNLLGESYERMQSCRAARSCDEAKALQCAFCLCAPARTPGWNAQVARLRQQTYRHTYATEG